jgi:uroporphyrinogen III methyltransferase/synthase
MDDAGQKQGQVYLVGAGPGNPRLLTLRAVECLAEADLVIHDRLVPAELLDYAPRAQRIGVADLPGAHCDKHERICDLMIEAARAGKTVVRLKGGDPGIFGRGGEEAAALQRAGIRFEIVPGVTAALAAAAYAGMPLTDRRYASTLVFVTGHECASGSQQVNWPALARLPGTLVVYMGLSRLAEIVETLLRHGKPAHTPAACVEWAGTARQVAVDAELHQLPQRVLAAGIRGPAVIVIGEGVRQRAQLGWFERLPLFGRRVLVTRPRHQAEEMVRELQCRGACVHIQPILEIGPPPDPLAVEQVLDRLEQFDWLVFTSANGVQALVQRLWQRGGDLRRLGGIRLAAIGKQTAQALERYSLRADYVPAEFRSEALAEGLAPLVAGQRVLLARADRGREVLAEQLRPVCQVEQVAVYSQREITSLDPQVAELLRAGRLDFVTLTSSNIARAFLNLLAEAEKAFLGSRVHLVTISPVTSVTVKELGFPVAAEAEEYTARGVVEAVTSLACRLREAATSIP